MTSTRLLPDGERVVDVAAAAAADHERVARAGELVADALRAGRSSLPVRRSSPLHDGDRRVHPVVEDRRCTSRCSGGTAETRLSGSSSSAVASSSARWPASAGRARDVHARPRRAGHATPARRRPKPRLRTAAAPREQRAGERRHDAEGDEQRRRVEEPQERHDHQARRCRRRRGRRRRPARRRRRSRGSPGRRRSPRRGPAAPRARTRANRFRTNSRVTPVAERVVEPHEDEAASTMSRARRRTLQRASAALERSASNQCRADVDEQRPGAGARAARARWRGS